MYAIGIDGGGTSTRACLINDGLEILGIGKSGPSSVDTVSSDFTRQSVLESINNAFFSAGISSCEVSGIMAGIGGIVNESQKIGVSEMIFSASLCKKKEMIVVENDMKIALAGGNVLEPGIAVIIGTGSVAYGKNRYGIEMKTGGWGYKEGDAGSSYDLGISAIRSLVRAYDGREDKTPFNEAVFEYLKLKTIDDLTDLLYQKNMSRTEIAAIAPLVTKFADIGDKRAVVIVEAATSELALMIETIHKKLFLPYENINAVIIGGLGNSGGFFSEQLKKKVAAYSPNIRLMPARLDPVLGAALWALRNAGAEFSLIDIEKKLLNRKTLTGL